MPNVITLRVDAFVTTDQLSRIAATMKRDDPQKRWTDAERKRLAKMRLLLELRTIIQQRWPDNANEKD